EETEVGPRQSRAVEDGGVVELIADDDVPLAHESGDGPQVRLVAGGEDDRGRAAFERRDLLFEAGVQRRAAVDQLRPAGPSAELLDRGPGRRLHSGVVREAEVVVRREHQVIAPAGPDARPLWPVDLAHVEIPVRLPRALDEPRPLAPLLDEGLESA